MVDVSGEWVEIAEGGEPGTHVFRRSDSDIPPTRAGRRLLILESGGTAELRAPGPTDRREPVAEGHWSMTGRTFHAELDHLAGDYQLELPDSSTLILRTPAMPPHDKKLS